VEATGGGASDAAERAGDPESEIGCPRLAQRRIALTTAPRRISQVLSPVSSRLPAKRRLKEHIVRGGILAPPKVRPRSLCRPALLRPGCEVQRTSEEVPSSVYAGCPYYCKARLTRFCKSPIRLLRMKGKVRTGRDALQCRADVTSLQDPRVGNFAGVAKVGCAWSSLDAGPIYALLAWFLK
jgi:hypothetical protein